MVVKVCGIKSTKNLSEIGRLPIDMIGLNFYPPSKRFISDDYDASTFDIFPPEIKRVGIFVNAKIQTIDNAFDKYKLDYVQLHGDENILFCDTVAKKYKLIKVFRIDDDFDFKVSLRYGFADYVLFDTQTRTYGGSGKKFDWSRLQKYEGNVPFLLSGGIGPEDLGQLLLIDHPLFAGIDINSKFEIEPGEKDIELLRPFVQKFKVAKKLT